MSPAAPGLLASVAGGSIAALWSILSLIAYGGLISAGPLAPLLPFYLVATLMGLAISTLVIAVFSALRGMTAVTSGVCAVINAAVFTTLAPGLPAHGITGAAAAAGFLVIVSGALTIVTGIALVVLGQLRLGGLARMFPYPVMAGFFAGLGWLLLVGGLRIGAGLSGHVLDGHALDSETLGRLAACATLAGLLILVPRFVRHWSVLPLLLAVGGLAVHVARLALGADIALAQQGGWLLGPYPAGGLPSFSWHLVRVAAAPDMAPPIIQAAVSSMFLAVSSLVLFVAGLEKDLRRTLDIDRELRVAGAANVLGGLAGGLPTSQAMNATRLLHDMGGATRIAALVPVGWIMILLLAGPQVIDFVPAILPGALLLSNGFSRSVLGIWRDCRRLPWYETVIAVAVAIAIAWLGIIDGLVVGLAMAVGLFAWSYRRIPVIRVSLPGSAYHSRVVRSPASLRVLQQTGDAVLAYRLQGFLFFLNANAIVAAVSSHLRHAKNLDLLILEFRDVVGIDSSALYTFERLFRLAQEADFRIVLTDLPPGPGAQIVRSDLLLAGGARVRMAATADLALEQAENRLLAASGHTATAVSRDFAASLSDHAGSRIDPARLAPFTDRVTLGAGEVLIRQGDQADALYFLERGNIVAELQREAGAPVRLMAAEAGALVGELALYAGAVRSATVVASTPSSLVRLTEVALARMAEADPALAFVVQGFVLRQVAERLIDTSRLLDTTLR